MKRPVKRKPRRTGIRQVNSPQPDRSIAPAYIRRGFYLTITDYARRAGVTRLTAYNQLERGEIDGVRIGPKTVLIRVKS